MIREVCGLLQVLVRVVERNETSERADATGVALQSGKVSVQLNLLTKHLQSGMSSDISSEEACLEVYVQDQRLIVANSDLLRTRQVCRVHHGRAQCPDGRNGLLKHLVHERVIAGDAVVQEDLARNADARALQRVLV